MALKDKVYSFLFQRQLFGKSYDEVMKKFCNENQSIKDCKVKTSIAIDELVKDKKIKLQNNVISNAKSQQSEQTFHTGTFFRHGSYGRIEANINDCDRSFFVPRSNTLNAPDNSTVLFSVSKVDDEIIANIAQITKIENSILNGYITKKGTTLFFVPEDPRFTRPLHVFVKDHDIEDKLFNQKVWVNLNEPDFIKANSDTTVEINSEEQIYGSQNNPWAHILSFIKTKGIATEFKEETLKEAEEIDEKISDEDLKDLVDFRDKAFVTIDPKDAKDLDDAIYEEKILENDQIKYYDIYIAIADVSHFVKPGSSLDKEANSRGTSYYPGGFVIPMLPEKLSNGVCSLDPNVDRLAVVTKVRIDRNGEIVSYNISEGVIKSRQKFSYNDVSSLHADEKEATEKFSGFKDLVELFYETNRALLKNARLNNRLYITNYQPTIILNDKKDCILDIVNDNPLDSHNIIENVMILNDVVAAKFLNALNVPHISRNHKEPTFQSFEALKRQLQELKIPTEENLSSQSYFRMLENIKASKYEKIASSFLIRSMQKARYSTNNDIGHFALGVNAYIHFTSPIRRCEDLNDQRITVDTLNNIKNIVRENNIDTNQKDLSEIISKVKQIGKGIFGTVASMDKLTKAATHFNDCEQKSKSLEEISDSICYALFMQNLVGQKFNGYISQVNNDGAIVTLKSENNEKHSDIIEVQVPFVDLFSAQRQYALGDNVKILITDVDILNRKVNATTQIDLYEQNKKAQETKEETTKDLDDGLVK